MPGTDGNQRVTNAIIGIKIDNLTDIVEKKIDDDKKRVDKVDIKLHALEIEQTRLKTIVGVWNSINSLGIIASTAIKGFINGG